MVKVVKHFGQFQSKVDYTSSVEQVLATLPEEYLQGLEAVVLRDTASLTRQERRAGRDRYDGFYVKSRARKRPPRIEIFLDNILDPIPRWLRWSSLFCKETVHGILLHEVGHHLQATLLPRRDMSEDNAWELAVPLWWRSFRQRHPVLVLWARMAHMLVRLGRRIIKVLN